MTKKHFIMAANNIAAMPESERAAHAEAWIKVCAASNPRFDKARFLAACKVPAGKNP